MSPSLAASVTKFDSANFDRAIIDVMDFNIIERSDPLKNERQFSSCARGGADRSMSFPGLLVLHARG